MNGDIERRTYPRRRLGGMSCPVNERVVYECPAGMVATITHVHVTNTHTGNETFRLHHCRQNESSGTHNALFYDYSLSAKAYLLEETTIYMTPGERIVCSAPSTGRITINVYGFEQ